MVPFTFCDESRFCIVFNGVFLHQFFLVQWVRRYVFFLIGRVVSILPAHYGVGSFACVKLSGWEIEKVYNLGPVVKRVKPRPQSTLSGSFYIKIKIFGV